MPDLNVSISSQETCCEPLMCCCSWYNGVVIKQLGRKGKFFFFQSQVIHTILVLDVFILSVHIFSFIYFYGLDCKGQKEELVVALKTWLVLSIFVDISLA